MPFQQSLSSIFLPSTSIYASIDQAPPSSSSSRTRPPQPNQIIYSTAQDAPEEQRQDAQDIDEIPEIDPFSSVTPSVLSPVRTKNQPLPPPSHPHEPIQEEDPFYDDPDHAMPHSRLRSEGEVNPTSSLSTSSRVMGSKSLMGLLGGTTYRSENTYRSTREEEETEGMEEESLREADEQDHHLTYQDETEGKAERRQR